MKADTIRNATEAHGWVGLIISVPLFIIFWAGAITLFYPEVHRWASMPHFPLEADVKQAPLNDLIEDKLEQFDFDSSHALFLRLPSEYSPYIEMHIPVHHDESDESPEEEGADHHDEVDIMVDPYSGEVLVHGHPFYLANFLNQMHYSLKIPQGFYIVGVITFFFFVIVITGVVIQLKNIIRHFFLYRHDKQTRYQMNDLHNVVGVISLPYAFMYALTGLMFNLGVLFQLPVLFLMFQGDSDAMFEAAGFGQFEQEPAHVAYAMPDLDNLVERVERDNDASLQTLVIHNYGDQNAVVELNGAKNDGFAEAVALRYRVSTADFPEEINGDDNFFADGISLVFSLHLANFAGVDLRWVYFILAIGICGMIVAGNVLWIAKRQKKAQYPRTIAITRALTLGGCMGVMLATVAAFMMERVLPVGLESRSDIIAQSFGIVLFLCAAVAFFNKDYKKYIAATCMATAAALLALILVDLSMFGPTLWTMFNAGYMQPLAVNFGLIISSAIYAWIGLKLLKPSTIEAQVKNRQGVPVSAQTQAGHIGPPRS